MDITSGARENPRIRRIAGNEKDISAVEKRRERQMFANY
jgi:hypothetical protein